MAYTWIPFYMELADTMLLYRYNRHEMIEKIGHVYDEAGMKKPKLDNVDPPADMDPFTVFGLINKGITEENRKRLCSAMKSVFGLKNDVPTGSEGVCVLNPLNASFYRFSDDPDRGENDIDNLWSLFSAAIDYADKPSESIKASFVSAFDAVKDIKGNRWKLTMGLYWIRPDTYLALDSRNREFITGEGKIDDGFAKKIKVLKGIPDGSEYLDLCSECREILDRTGKYTSVSELSYDAWFSSVNKDEWWPSKEEYDPGITQEKWIELLKDKDVFDQNSLSVMAAFYAAGGAASCKQLADEYGQTYAFYNIVSTKLAQRIIDKVNCPVSYQEDGSARRWTVLFVGRDADKNDNGTFIWKLRQELYDALHELGIEQYLPVDSGTENDHAWLLTWHPGLWTWNDYNQWISNIQEKVDNVITWSCANTKVKAGDRFYLTVCGKGVPHGIIGSGTVVSAPKMRPHWNDEKREKGIQYRSVEVTFDKLVDYNSSDILSTEKLNQVFPEQVWSPQASGIAIKSKYVSELQNLWYGEEMKQIKFAAGYDSGFSRNRIIFGAPGTGKSYKLNSEKNELLKYGGQYERVTFHPDYSYAHFVGTYKPVPCKDENGCNTITYKYVPGPFMRMYVEALKNSRTGNPKPFLLIVEEINRANVAAVFGDIFQLLDRDEEETSEYPIQTSEDIRQYLSEELGGETAEYNEMKLPDNMFIWATMNSADQGVFPMDTAFKRRWDFTYLSIDTNEKGISGKKVVLGKGECRREVEWNVLRHAINDKLSSFRLNEDKLLGPYFLSRKIIPEAGEINEEKFVDAFKNKVLMYLFEDAAKQKRSSLFADGIDTTKYSSVCSAFDEKGVFVFCTDISSKFGADAKFSEGENE